MTPVLNKCQGHGKHIALFGPYFPSQTLSFPGFRPSVQSDPCKMKLNMFCPGDTEQTV